MERIQKNIRFDDDIIKQISYLQLLSGLSQDEMYRLLIKRGLSSYSANDKMYDKLKKDSEFDVKMIEFYSFFDEKHLLFEEKTTKRRKIYRFCADFLYFFNENSEKHHKDVMDVGFLKGLEIINFVFKEYNDLYGKMKGVFGFVLKDKGIKMKITELCKLDSSAKACAMYSINNNNNSKYITIKEKIGGK